MKKSELKSGMVLENITGIRYIVIGSSIHSNCNTWDSLIEYNEDLTHKSMPLSNISKVYESKDDDNYFAVELTIRDEKIRIHEHMDLIWERK